MTKTALYRHYDPIKFATLSRWLEKIIADGPEDNPLLKNPALLRERHEAKISAARSQLLSMRAAQ